MGTELESKDILVTGGAGFIGSDLANELAVDNEVRVVDDGYLGIQENLRDEVEFHELSVLDGDLPTKVDIVFHLAALSSYAKHESDPCRGARVNVEGFVNTIEQAREDGCSMVVYASTASVYGDRTTPTSEGTGVTANTGFEASMLARERYAEYFANHYGMDMAGIRLFSVYQGYQTTEVREKGYANVVAQFADDIAHGRSPVLYGNGEQTHDFTHIKDVVRGLVTAAENELLGVYNVGTGRSVSLNDLVELIGAELEMDAEPEYIENPIRRSAYVRNATADYSKIRAETGWEPQIPLEEGLARVCSQYESGNGSRRGHR